MVAIHGNASAMRSAACPKSSPEKQISGARAERQIATVPMSTVRGWPRPVAGNPGGPGAAIFLAAGSPRRARGSRLVMQTRVRQKSPGGRQSARQGRRRLHQAMGSPVLCGSRLRCKGNPMARSHQMASRQLRHGGLLRQAGQARGRPSDAGHPAAHVGASTGGVALPTEIPVTGAPPEITVPAAAIAVHGRWQGTGGPARLPPQIAFLRVACLFAPNQFCLVTAMLQCKKRWTAPGSPAYYPGNTKGKSHAVHC
jgi:hypothetical protein